MNTALTNATLKKSTWASSTLRDSTLTNPTLISSTLISSVVIGTNMMNPKSLRYSSLIIGALLLAGCKTEEITTTSYYPAVGTYNETQTVRVQVPPTASNVYLTTDSVTPVAQPRCAYSGENLTIDRTTLIKVAYDVAGKHYVSEGLYVLENNPVDSGYTNRSVVTTWERFFVTQVLRQFSVPNEDSSTLTLEDGEGGNVTLQTNILDRSILGAPEAGEQRYSFNKFKMTEEDSGLSVTINSGNIYGYRDEEDGFYTTLENEYTTYGSRLEFSGSYNGWADGDFKMDATGKTLSGGYYEIMCFDNGCANHPVTYRLGSRNQFIEVTHSQGANTRSCQEPPVVETIEE